MKFKSTAATHVGMVRKLNEDSYVERPEIGVWAVADGMGGHAAGDMASQTVTEFIGALEPPEDFGEMVEALRQCLHDANHQLLSQAGAYDENRLPGSTVVVLAIKGSQGAVLWSGDSRIYRQRDEQLTRLTHDHSHVQELLDMNMIRAEDAESHPMANVITRALGIVEPLEIDTRMLEVRPGDQFLLCSDGLSRLASDQEIESILVNTDGDEIVQSLLHTALVRGAPDNVTLIYVAQGDAADSATDEDESTVVVEEAYPGDFTWE